MKIVICAARGFAEQCAAELRCHLPAADIVVRVSSHAGAATTVPVERRAEPRPESRAATQAANQADYALVWKPPTEFFDEQRALKAVFVLGAGVDALLALPTLAPDLPVLRLEDAGMAGPMADYVLGAVLHVHLRFDTYAAHRRAHRWREETTLPKERYQVGVLGIGAIGGEVARVLAAHGFAVRGYSRSRRAIPGVRCHAGPAEFDVFLAGLDVLVSVLPLTAENAGILNHATLSKLAHGAHLVNVGRGAHLVEADLLTLLDAGKLSGATLDVFATEPLPAEHPFWSRPEIVLTPHASAVTEIEPGIAQIARKIEALERGEAVSGLVDRARGY